MPSRRSFLVVTTVSLVSLAGCSGMSATDLFVDNDTEDEQTATLRVVRKADGEQLLDETFTLTPDESTTFEEVVSGSEVRVTLDVQDGTTASTEWADGEDDANGLHVNITSEGITFQPVVA